MKLVDKTDETVSEYALLVFTNICDGLPVDEYLAGSRIVQAAHDLQQRGLARAGCANNSEPFRLAY